MQQYGFTEDEITETIASAGYADGGRVGFMFGSPEDPRLTEYLMQKTGKKDEYLVDFSGKKHVTHGSYKSKWLQKDRALKWE